MAIMLLQCEHLQKKYVILFWESNFSSVSIEDKDVFDGLNCFWYNLTMPKSEGNQYYLSSQITGI